MAELGFKLRLRAPEAVILHSHLFSYPFVSFQSLISGETCVLSCLSPGSCFTARPCKVEVRGTHTGATLPDSHSCLD